MNTYFKCRTDSGDESDIVAASLVEAATIAAERISPECWEDGAWCVVEDPETGEILRVIPD